MKPRFRRLCGLETLEVRRLLAAVSHPVVVSENPADTTPHIVLDGASLNVYDFEQIGRTMFAGGRFNEVWDPARTTTYARQNFVAYDAETGVISPLDLSFNGVVTGIEASEDGTALFISGAFSNVNGITRRGIAKYDLVNNQIDSTFAPTGMRTVSDIELVNGQLIAAGNFSGHLRAMDPITGEDLGTLNITVSGVVNATDETRIKEIAVSPDGTRLVATGNFASVNGRAQKLAFMMHLGSPATLSTWHAPRFDVDCPAVSRLSARGVDFSPDSSYFVIVSTGGNNKDGLCDAAARFETANESSTVEPTWINWTGGDTLYSVAITGPAVYVGGHQRWLDNPDAMGSAGPGAVSRPGIGAIDPVTGLALEWNPTKSRNHGTLALFATPDGLWVGSDGERFGGEDHAGIGFVPLDLNTTPDTTRPKTMIDSGPSGLVSSSAATFSFSANESASFQCRIDSAAFEACTSPVTYDDLTAGSHTFEVVAVDTSYNMDASPAERSWTLVAPGNELVGNSGFEVDTVGWKGDATANTLTRVAGGHSGSWAMEVSNSAAGGRCGFDDSPSWVTSTDDGTYTASIWVRSDTPGETVKLRVREYSDGENVGSETESLALTSSWQPLAVSYAAVARGSRLDLDAYASSAPAGVCFQVDDVSITLDVPEADPEVIITESGDSTEVTEGGATDTYDVVLSAAPTADVKVTVISDDQSTGSVVVPGVTTIVEANFDSGSDGFGYVDDSFRGTSRADYATGERLATGGFSGGGLQITLGGLNNADIFGMSGGWQRDFTLNEPSAVTFSFVYNMFHAASYEKGELSQVLVSVDGVLFGEGPNDYIAQLEGEQSNESSQTTGWQSFELTTGVLSAGTHTLTIGAYNNKKTFYNEFTELRIDDVVGVTKSSSDLIFTTATWSFPQTVVVTSVDDELLEGPHSSTITHTVSSADPSYDVISVDSVIADVTDDDSGPQANAFLSFADSKTLPGGLSVKNEDIVSFDGTTFSMFMDGSDVGLNGTNVDALAVVSFNEVLLSFSAPETIPGIPGTVEDSDIVKFTASQLGGTTSGTFELFFRGSDVGLSPGSEDVVAIDMHNDGRLLVSTKASYEVPGVSGRDEDLIAFTPTVPGEYLTGTWEMFFDGSDVELGSEDVDAVALNDAGDIHLSTTRSFSATGVSGEDEDVFVFVPEQGGDVTTGAYSPTLLFDGSLFGLDTNDLDGFDVAAPGGSAGDALQIIQRPVVAVQTFAVESYTPSYDVSANGEVTALDALQVINSVSIVSNLSDRHIDDLDVNEDGILSALDALLIINHLSSHSVALANRAAPAQPTYWQHNPDTSRSRAILELMDEQQFGVKDHDLF